MGATTYGGLNVLATFLDINTLVGIFLQGFLAGIIGIVTGIIVLRALKSQELVEVWRVLRGKFWKVGVIATDPEIV